MHDAALCMSFASRSALCVHDTFLSILADWQRPATVSLIVVVTRLARHTLAKCQNGVDRTP
jgi:hypothetical protein